MSIKTVLVKFLSYFKNLFVIGLYIGPLIHALFLSRKPWPENFYTSLSMMAIFTLLLLLAAVVSVGRSIGPLLLALLFTSSLKAEDDDAVRRWLPQPGTPVVNIFGCRQNDFQAGQFFAAPVEIAKHIERNTNAGSGWVVRTSGSGTNTFDLWWLLPINVVPSSMWAVVQCTKAGATEEFQVVPQGGFTTNSFRTVSAELPPATVWWPLTNFPPSDLPSPQRVTRNGSIYVRHSEMWGNKDFHKMYQDRAFGYVEDWSYIGSTARVTVANERWLNVCVIGFPGFTAPDVPPSEAAPRNTIITSAHEPCVMFTNGIYYITFKP